MTASTNQCCHNSMTALLAAREGMACRVIMESWGDVRYRYETAGNHAMMELCGPEETAVVTDPPSGPVEDMPEARRMAEEARASGKTPWFLSRGGSGPLGALGYVRCAGELVDQWGEDLPEAVVCPCGIGGTQAGLRLLGCPVPVVGIGVTGKSGADMERFVRSQCRELTDFLETDPIPEEAVRCLDSCAGGGYGKPCREQIEWMRALASSQGILTDPVYSGKALYGLCGLAAKGEYAGPGGLVFLHTGGLQLFYDFSSLAEV
ncbi:MAG: pyridoxal-phosphate dependent enzyme [Oscillibacter sp.]|nr:pyridoxal-phosphate dependent enzyme [Oscillibacter sp.]